MNHKPDSLSSNMQLLLTWVSQHAQLIKRLDRKMALHGISFTEFQIMLRLANAESGAMRRIDLAESIGLTASGVTRLLSPMEKIKLVSKESNARDARVSLVKLTKTGEKLLLDALTSFAEVSDYLLSGLNSKEVMQLQKLLAKTV